MTHDTDNRSQGRKKSNFPVQTTILSGAKFDYVVQGTNFSIIDTDFFNALGVTGIIVQDGAVAATPVLDKAGTVNNIRNLENGPGAKASVSPENGITLEHNFAQGTGGAPVLANPTALQPTIQNLLAGTGINVSTVAGGIQIASTSAPVSTNTVIVSQMSDFPTPVGGVITLEANKDYLVVNDLTTSDRFVMSNGTVFRASTLTTEFTYSGSEALFTGVDVSSQVLSITIDEPTGDVIDMSDTVFSHQFQMIGCRLKSYNTFGVVDGMQQVRIDGTQIDNQQVDGLIFSNACGLLLFDTQLATVNAGSLIDLGTATFNGISLISPFVNLAGGTFLISGAAASANLNAGGLGSVNNGRNIGAGSYLSGISVDDDQWFFSGNDGVQDTHPDALITMQANATSTTIVTQSVPVLVAGTWAEESASQTTTTAAGRVTYNAIRSARLPLTAALTIAPVSGGSQIMGVSVAIDGVVVANSLRTASASPSSAASITVLWQESVSAGGFVEIFASNESGTVDVLVTSATFRAN